MSYSTREKITILLEEVSNIKQIRAIGQSGDVNVIPKVGETDIDLFVFGDSIPGYEERKEIYDKISIIFDACSMNVCEGGVWGTGDIFLIDGVETMLMYFTTEETSAYLNGVLEGNQLDSVRGFYPIGRCSTLKNLAVIYDEAGVLASFKEKLSIYPEKLQNDMVLFHLQKVNDQEDFGRALLRKDVLFYHQVLEVALDHYLQALYAVNKTFFPSRKRSQRYIDSFAIKPENCYPRLLKVIELGATPDHIEKSYMEWCMLVDELKELCGL